jgi:uncharacterized protein
MALKDHSNRAAFWAALFCILAAAAVSLFALNRSSSSDSPDVKAAGSRETLTIETRTGPREFSIEVARTPDQQAMGLMYRTSLPDTQGMLFPHSEPREVTMWMRNTYIPLDMVFIRTDGVVHRIEANTEPMSERVIASQGLVGGVLEIAGGAAARLGIAPGDKVRHTLIGADQQAAPK